LGDFVELIFPVNGLDFTGLEPLATYVAGICWQIRLDHRLVRKIRPMPIPTPFYPRTSVLSESYEWSEWSGYLAAITYEPTHDREYWAIRNSAGLLDVTPLYKYEIVGPDALRVVDRIMTRDISRCRVGQVMYSPWCDEDGKVIDDGTITRLAEDRFRVTAADPNLRWFQDCGYGLDADVIDVSADLATLALQGPRSCDVLAAAAADPSVANLKYFRMGQFDIGGAPVTVTRTGYTGDLGYELWMAPEHALAVWDRLMAVGRNFGMLPAGLAALDIVRIEAALLLIEVDYISSHKALIPSQKSSPFDLGLGWTVKLDKDDFVGQRALIAEKAQGSKWAFVGMEIDWIGLEELFSEVDLPPQVVGRASRAAVPIYKHGRQIGQATSTAFSPILKKYLAIGTIEREYATPGAPVDIEITVEYHRKKAQATIVKTPFFNRARQKVQLIQAALPGV
jgi:aminomethyltransferase